MIIKGRNNFENKLLEPLNTLRTHWIKEVLISITRFSFKWNPPW